MKKIISILLTFAIIATLPITIWAAVENPERNERIFYINAEKQNFHTIFIDDIEYVCIQDLNEILKYEEDWDAETQTMRLWGAYRDIEFTVGSPIYYANGWINHLLWNSAKLNPAYPDDVAECVHIRTYPPLLLDGKIYIPVSKEMFNQIFSADYGGGKNIIDLSMHPAFYDVIISKNSGFNEGMPGTTKSFLKGLKIKDEISLIQSSYILRYSSLLSAPQLPKMWYCDIEGLVKEVLTGAVDEDIYDGADDHYLICFENGEKYEIVLGSNTEINTRCFDSDYNEITPANIKSIEGTIVRLCQKSEYKWGYYEHRKEETDRTVYALIRDNVDTANYYAEQERIEAERPKDVKVWYNCAFIEFDQQPIIENGRTLVPMRKIFETLGATVDWNGETQTITSTKGDTTIILTVGNKTAYKNGEAIELDVPAKIINGRTLVPVRFIAESLDITVEWDDYYKIVSLW